MTDCQDSWDDVELGQLASINMGQSPPSLSYNYEEVGLPFLQGCADFGDRHPNTTLYCSDPSKIACEGEILISVRAPVGALNVADRDYCIGRGLASIDGTQVANDYLSYLLEFSIRTLKTKAQGTTFEAVDSEDLRTWAPPSRADCPGRCRSCSTPHR